MDVVTLRDAALDLFFPCTHCMVCGEARGVQEGLCAECREKMQALPEAVCMHCGRPLSGRAHCPACAAAPPPYVAARAVYVYEGVVRRMIHKMKFSAEYDLPVRRFGREMAQLAEGYDWHADAVVCVPTAAQTLRQRGYNQAALLAKRVAWHLELPFWAQVLQKKKGVRSQVGLSAQERRDNILGSIQPGRDCAHILDKTLLLVDDVMTTGATVEECVRVLLRNGARAVYVLCAARRLYEDGEDLKRETEE